MSLCTATMLLSDFVSQSQIGLTPDGACVNGESAWRNSFGYVSYNGATYDGRCSFFGGKPALPEGEILSTAPMDVDWLQGWDGLSSSVSERYLPSLPRSWCGLETAGWSPSQPPPSTSPLLAEPSLPVSLPPTLLASGLGLLLSFSPAT